VDAALAQVKDGYAVIHETSDNPGGGCPGNGTHLLRELLRRDMAGSIFGVIYDPAAAQACHAAGVGAKLHLCVGGHSEPVFGAPVEMEAEVLGLSDGTFVCASPMYPNLTLRYGPTARVRCGQVEVVLVSRQMQSYDDRPLRMTGAKMEDYRLVALKSTNHFRAYFKDTADAIITADTPGLFPADLKKLNYRHMRRPIFPLDGETVWEAEA
jgi:microcystin degradation protein MlrC